MRTLAKSLLAAAIALSWAGPLCAMPAPEPSHACCPDGRQPSDPASRDSACCLSAGALPAAAVAAPSVAPVAALPSVALVAPVPAVRRAAVAPALLAAPQAPPGTHSGLSPPASGL